MKQESVGGEKRIFSGGKVGQDGSLRATLWWGKGVIFHIFASHQQALMRFRYR